VWKQFLTESSSFTAEFFNNSKVKKKFGRRAKFMYKYECDDKDVMQSMRDVRNLFHNDIDADPKVAGVVAAAGTNRKRKRKRRTKHRA